MNDKQTMTVPPEPPPFPPPPEGPWPKSAATGPIRYFSDREMLTALASWLLVCADHRTHLRLMPGGPAALECLTVDDAMKADILLRHALLQQPSDLNRLMVETRFRDPRSTALLQSAWGNERDCFLAEEDWHEAETQEAETQNFQQARMRDLREKWPWVILGGAVGWGLAKLDQRTLGSA